MVETELGAVQIKESGEGPAVLLLHGVGSAHAAFDEQVSALAGPFRLIAWDAPGYGRSEDVMEVSGIGAYATAAHQVLQHLDAIPVHLVGVSWGGVVATRLALDFPRCVRTLVLIASTVGRASSLEAKRDIRERIALLNQGGVEQWARQRVDRVLGRSAAPELREKVRDMMISSVRIPGFENAAMTLATTDHRPRLGEISVPTLIITGDKDGVTGLPEALTLADGIPHARMCLIERAGHLVNQEQALAVNTALRDFWLSEEGMR